MSESVGRVGGSNESESTIIFGVIECDKGIFKGIESVGHSVIDIAIEVGVSDKPMNNFSCTHLITISNYKNTNIIAYHIIHIISNLALLAIYHVYQRLLHLYYLVQVTHLPSQLVVFTL